MNEQFRKHLEEGTYAGMRYGIGVPRSIQRGLIGGQLGNRSGSSLDFMDHREYMPGDDLRRIDWSAFARSDKLSIKLYRNEVNPHVDIVIDCSRSMNLPETEKARATLGLAAVFAQAAFNSDYSYAAWQIRETCYKVANGADRPAFWSDIEFDGQLSCDRSFRNQLPSWRPQGVRVLLSDLFWLTDPYETLSIVADKASAVYVVQILAQNDTECGKRGNLRLYDTETGEIKNVFVDAVAEQRYKKNLAQHQYNWSRCCKQLGVVMTTVVAEEITDNWQLDELVSAEILKVL